MVAVVCTLLLTVAPPAESGPTASPTRSVGKANGGQLQHGKPMSLHGKHHHFTGTAKRRKTNYGTPEMITLIHRAAATVGHFVDGPPMILGSISKEHGGKFGPHQSHQSGRDVDILFYMVAPDGKRKRARGFYTFDDEGRCKHNNCKGWRFDVMANWWLVRTLVWSKRPQVQYIFVSKGLRSIMLAYAKERGEHPDILKRARKMLVQPGNSSPHADHFHVRIYCSNRDKGAGCTDFGPRWSWVESR